MRSSDRINGEYSRNEKSRPGWLQPDESIETAPLSRVAKERVAVTQFADVAVTSTAAISTVVNPQASCAPTQHRASRAQRRCRLALRLWLPVVDEGGQLCFSDDLVVQERDDGNSLCKGFHRSDLVGLIVGSSAQEG
jgi:hypothetical protein